jgi:hypothetical protein
MINRKYNRDKKKWDKEKPVSNLSPQEQKELDRKKKGRR